MAEITPKGSKDYVTAVQKLLTTIEGNPVGQVITRAMKASGKNLLIQPMSEWTGPGEKQCRAITWPEDRSTSTPKGTGGKNTDLRGKWYFGKEDDEDTDRDERFDAAGSSKVAAGGGSNSLLYFTPGEWSGCGGDISGTLADEVLLHEMVHALRVMQGLFNQVPTVNASYSNEEEFLSIVVANVYISAKSGKRRLVANHVSHAYLQPPLDTSKGFVDDDDNRRLLSHYLFAWRPIFSALASLKPPKFNPFSEAIGRL